MSALCKPTTPFYTSQAAKFEIISACLFRRAAAAFTFPQPIFTVLFDMNRFLPPLLCRFSRLFHILHRFFHSFAHRDKSANFFRAPKIGSEKRRYFFVKPTKFSKSRKKSEYRFACGRLCVERAVGEMSRLVFEIALRRNHRAVVAAQRQ